MSVIQAFDPEPYSSWETLVRSHLPFVITLAKAYRRRGVPFEDLLNEGNVGLIEAARRFDAGHGVRFTTYASWWIRKFLLKAIGEQSRLVRIPEKRMRLVRAAREECATQSQLLGQQARPRDAAATSVEISLTDVPAAGCAPSPLVERLADPGQPNPEQFAIRADLERQLEVAVRRLSHRAWRLVRDRFGLDGVRPLTLREVAEREGVSKERVRQIETKALAWLERALTRRPPMRSSESMSKPPCRLAFEG